MGYSRPRTEEYGGWKKELCTMCFILQMQINAQGLRLALWYVVSDVAQLFYWKVPLVSKRLLSLTKLSEQGSFVKGRGSLQRTIQNGLPRASISPPWKPLIQICGKRQNLAEKRIPNAQMKFAGWARARVMEKNVSPGEQWAKAWKGQGFWTWNLGPWSGQGISCGWWIS